MIAHIAGKVAEKFNNTLIVDVNGVGYEVQVLNHDFEQALLEQKIKLYTYHHIREQSQELFGFSSLTHKKMFELLISVQGIGPKAALAILGLADSETVRSAIANKDAKFIAQASGVGKKSAERVIIDLSDKVGLSTSYTAAAISSNDEALNALMALGLSLAEASAALQKVSPDLPTAERVTKALRQ